MGNAVIWYYPDPLGTAERIDLAQKLTTRDGPTLFVRQSVSESYTGHQTTVHYGARNRLRLRLEWGGRGTVTSEQRQLRQQLVGLTGHLRRGGTIVFAEDEAYAWATYARVLPGRLTTDISIVAPPWTENLAPAVAVQDREIATRSSAPLVYEEMRSASTHAAGGGTITITPRLSYDYTGQTWMLLRESGTWPAMRLPRESRNEPLLTHDHEIKFMLDLPLEEAENALDAMAGSEGALLGTTDGPSQTLPEIESEGIINDGDVIGSPFDYLKF